VRVAMRMTVGMIFRHNSVRHLDPFLSIASPTVDPLFTS